MNKMNALIVGSINKMTASLIPEMLYRAQFNVDLLLLSQSYKKSKYVNQVYCANNFPELIDLAAKVVQDSRYDLIVIGDDEALREIHHSSLPTDLKFKLLPVLSITDFKHLHSKVGLSEVLSKSSLETPEYCVVNSENKLLDSVEKFGYPSLLKIDFSLGGKGVFECNGIKDAQRHKERLSYPLLIQRRVEGEAVDLSGFYQKGELIYFTYSNYEKIIGGQFGTSAVRTFTQLGYVEKAIFEELQLLGRALGADGFVNILSILSPLDGRRYYIEADMRPNIWFDHGRVVGNDIATSINQFFTNGAVLSYPQPKNPAYLKTVLVPHISRLFAWEILSNQYDCHRFIGGTSKMLWLTFCALVRPLMLWLYRQLAQLVPGDGLLSIRTMYYRLITLNGRL